MQLALKEYAAYVEQVIFVHSSCQKMEACPNEMLLAGGPIGQ